MSKKMSVRAQKEKAKQRAQAEQDTQTVEFKVPGTDAWGELIGAPGEPPMLLFLHNLVGANLYLPLEPYATPADINRLVNKYMYTRYEDVKYGVMMHGAA